MDTFIGVAELALIVWAVAAWRRRRNASRPAPPPAARLPVPQAPPPPPGPPGGRGPSGADPIAGWLIGHQIARGHAGFPGDPLPGGHLGRPVDLAFWGGMFTDDEEEDAGGQDG